LQIVYVASSGEKLPVHDHPSDQTCHWVTVLKPLALIISCDPLLMQSLVKSSYSRGKLINKFDKLEYIQWLCEKDERGFLNLLNILLHVCDLRDVPTP
jgi:hypothetical protein